jgi:hypothetical protein
LSHNAACSPRPPAHSDTYRIYHCFLRDPNGYLVEFQRFDDPL